MQGAVQLPAAVPAPLVRGPGRCPVPRAPLPAAGAADQAHGTLRSQCRAPGGPPGPDQVGAPAAGRPCRGTWAAQCPCEVSFLFFCPKMLNHEWGAIPSDPEPGPFPQFHMLSQESEKDIGETKALHSNTRRLCACAVPNQSPGSEKLATTHFPSENCKQHTPQSSSHCGRTGPPGPSHCGHCHACARAPPFK